MRTVPLNSPAAEDFVREMHERELARIPEDVEDAPGDDTPEPSQEDIDDINERNPAYQDARDKAYERGR